ncbi:MAG: SGNH/GDSL hydrolase family protein [Anaerolineales bacterium]|nr:SGNH/GDSL hydrolase family protein [Anaerolineales bacterium]
MIARLTFLLLLCLTACAAPVPTLEETTSMPTIRYLALGDSYTIGESVDEPERWSMQLASLMESSPQIAKRFGGTEGGRVEVTIIARTGWTVDELWDGIQAQKINPPYDLVSLLIGVNNQYRGRDLEEYREQFIFLLNKSIEYAGGDANRVIVLSIPDWGVTPFASDRDSKKIADEINQYNAVNRAETEKAGAHYIDITPISREAVNDPSLIAGDGLHPSGKMYAEWAKLALPVALKILTAEP